MGISVVFTGVLSTHNSNLMSRRSFPDVVVRTNRKPGDSFN